MAHLTVKLHPSPALIVRRPDRRTDRLVYVIVAQKRQGYRRKPSCIVYIGSTTTGFRRVAESAANHADEVFGLRGVREFQVRLLSCKGRRGAKTWKKLERALLLRFHEVHGDVPIRNKQGKRMQERDEFQYFTRDRLDKVLRELESYQPRARHRRTRRRGQQDQMSAGTGNAG